MKKDEIDQLFNAGKEQLLKLHGITRKSMQDEELIVENLLHPQREILTPGQPVSTKVVCFGGRMKTLYKIQQKEMDLLSQINTKPEVP